MRTEATGGGDARFCLAVSNGLRTCGGRALAQVRADWFLAAGTGPRRLRSRVVRCSLGFPGPTDTAWAAGSGVSQESPSHPPPPAVNSVVPSPQTMMPL